MVSWTICRKKARRSSMKDSGDDVLLRVEQMDKNRIEKIHIYRLEQPEEEKEEP